MADNKKSFILYCDQKEMFEHLPPELCKKLLLHLFSYVNDENPTSDDPILNALFSPIKHQLKRDLKKWETRAETSRSNGKLGGRPRTRQNPTKPNGLNNNLTEPVKPVNDTVTVTVNDIVIKEEEQPKVFNFKKSLLDLGVEIQIASDYLKVRSKKKASNTQTAFNSIKSQLEKSPLSPNESIKIAVEKSWSGFKAEWINNLDNNGTHQQTLKRKDEGFDNSRFKKHISGGQTD